MELIGRLVDLIAHALDHAGRTRSAALVVVRLVAGHLGLGALVGAEALRAVPVDHRGGVGLGEVDEGAFAGGSGPDDGGENPEGAEERAGVDADGHVLGDVRETFVVGGDVHDAGPGVVRHAVARVVAVGAGHAVARDAAEDDLRIERPQVVVSHPASGQRPRPHCLHHHVGGGGQLLHDLDARFGAQVEHQRALAPVEVQVHQRGAFHNGPRHLADVIASRWFDLDHVRTQVHQGRRDRGRPECRDLNDAQSVQGRRHRHRTSRRQRPDRSGHRPGHPEPDLAILGWWRRRPSRRRPSMTP